MTKSQSITIKYAQRSSSFWPCFFWLVLLYSNAFGSFGLWTETVLIICCIANDPVIRQWNNIGEWMGAGPPCSAQSGHRMQTSYCAGQFFLFFLIESFIVDLWNKGCSRPVDDVKKCCRLYSRPPLSVSAVMIVMIEGPVLSPLLGNPSQQWWAGEMSSAARTEW